MRQGVIRRVGVVGLGKMGRPMARHLRKAGFEVTGCDIDPSACGEAEKAGIAIADSPRALAQSSDFIIVVVGFDKEAETVILGSDGIAAGAAPGLLVGVASTVAPAHHGAARCRPSRHRCRAAGHADHARRAGRRGRRAAVMVGGDVAAFDACKPALHSFASSIFHLGDLGAGQVGKMVNNMILWSCISANFEGFKLAQALGVDLDRLRTALVDSSASNWALQTQIDRFPMPWAEKDMRIVLGEADDLRLSLPLCGVVTEVVKSVKIERGWPTPKLRDG